MTEPEPKSLYSTVTETISSLAELYQAALEAIRATLAHETAANDVGEDQSCQNAKERLRLARQAMIDIGYFTEDEVGDDVAPRIWEYNIHVKREIKHANHQQEMAEKRADDLATKLAQERDRVDRVRTALDNTYQIATTRGPYVSLDVIDKALEVVKDPEATL